MGRFDRSELLAGLAVMALGIFAIWVARDYPLGTIVRMGPGLAPLALGGLLVTLGAVLALQSRGAPAVPLGLRWRPFVLVPGGVLAWALLVDRAGFVPATAVLVTCCALVERETTWRTVAGLAVGLSLFGYVVFIRGLKVPFQPIARDLLAWI